MNAGTWTTRPVSVLAGLLTEEAVADLMPGSVSKPAKTETGLVVQVPAFINEGEKIRVDTAEGAYMSRA